MYSCQQFKNAYDCCTFIDKSDDMMLHLYETRQRFDIIYYKEHNTKAIGILRRMSAPAF